MPVFSIGGMRYQQSWQDMPLDQVEAENQRNLEATIARGLELGVNHIETARGYGSSERQLGKFLPTLPRDEIIVQTKVNPHPDPTVFTANFEDSLARLKLDYIDLLGVHGINDPRELWWALRPGGCLAAARKLVDRGLVRHVGFSTHGDLETILAVIGHEGDGGFDYVNLHWYYINQHNWPAIEAAAARDMGVFIISPSDKGGMLYDPPAKLVELCDPLHPLVFNCLFCLSRTGVHTLSLGAARPSDFDLQMETLELLDRADELLPPIDRRLATAMAETVGPELADGYEHGLPRWDRTPGYINIPHILWLLRLARGWNLEAYAKRRYSLLGNNGSWFQGANALAVDEVDLDNALKASPIAERIPNLLREAHQMLYEGPAKRLSQQ